MICDAVKVHAPRLANKRVEAQAIMCVPRLADFDWAHGCRHDLQESACQKYTNTEIGKHAKSLKSSPWSCCGADLSGLVCVCVALLACFKNESVLGSGGPGAQSRPAPTKPTQHDRENFFYDMCVRGLFYFVRGCVHTLAFVFCCGVVRTWTF